MKLMKKIKTIIHISPIVLLFIGCAGGNNTGIEYAPDMYYSKAYEPYSQADSHNYNAYGANMRVPVKGSIAFGKEDYSYQLANNGDGYALAATEITLPSSFIENSCEGARLYNIYCTPCHGTEGKNDGKVFQKVKTLIPGAWADGYQNDYIKNLPVGQIYHTLVYGKNNMGSHASVLNPTQRWQVINYVKQLSKGIVGCTNENNSIANNAVNFNDTILFTSYEKVKLADADMAVFAQNLAAIEFETGSDKLKITSQKSLDILTKILAKNPSLKIVINGHTDNAGDKLANMLLSKKRAEALKSYLIGKKFESGRLITNGFGDRKPLFNNDTDANRAKNRRVEIDLTK